MPRMNGKALLETLHSTAGTAGIPVLVMTALHGFESSRTIALGATDLVEKPFDIDELLNKVALAVYRARQERDGQAQADASRGVVLVVGDDRRLASALDRTVSALGYTAVSLMYATHELPRLARLLEPRLIVLVPARETGVTGEEAQTVEVLRAEAALSKVPVLVLSNEADDPSAELSRLLS